MHVCGGNGKFLDSFEGSVGAFKSSVRTSKKYWFSRYFAVLLNLEKPLWLIPLEAIQKCFRKHQAKEKWAYVHHLINGLRKSSLYLRVVYGSKGSSESQLGIQKLWQVIYSWLAFKKWCLLNLLFWEFKTLRSNYFENRDKELVEWYVTHFSFVIWSVLTVWHLPS